LFHQQGRVADAADAAVLMQTLLLLPLLRERQGTPFTDDNTTDTHP